MGTDKATIRRDGRTQLERVASCLATVLETVIVSVRSQRDDRRMPPGLDYVVDAIPDAGPLAGIVAAHRRLPDCALFVAAVDLFGLDEPAVRAFVHARNSGKPSGVTALRIVPARGNVRSAPYPDPLCAIWEPAVLRDAADAFELGERNPQIILRAARVRLVPNPNDIVNVNTPEELAAYTSVRRSGRKGRSPR